MNGRAALVTAAEDRPVRRETSTRETGPWVSTVVNTFAAEGLVMGARRKRWAASGRSGDWSGPYSDARVPDRSAESALKRPEAEGTRAGMPAQYGLRPLAVKLLTGSVRSWTRSPSSRPSRWQRPSGPARPP